MELHTLPLISTSHITPEVAHTLSVLREKNPWAAGAMWEFGFFLHLDDLPEGTPQCLIDIRDWLRSKNLPCWSGPTRVGSSPWIRIDRDGPEEVGLPIYDWDKEIVCTGDAIVGTIGEFRAATHGLSDALPLRLAGPSLTQLPGGQADSILLLRNGCTPVEGEALPDHLLIGPALNEGSTTLKLPRNWLDEYEEEAEEAERDGRSGPNTCKYMQQEIDDLRAALAKLGVSE